MKGGGDLKVKAQPVGGDINMTAVADFDGLQVKAVGDDGTASLDKPAGLPLRLDVDVKKSATSAVVNAVKLVIGKSSIIGKGQVTDIGGKKENLAVDFGSVDVAFDDLRQTIPGALGLACGRAHEGHGLDARRVVGGGHRCRRQKPRHGLRDVGREGQRRRRKPQRAEARR